eukprot:9849683-Heterocapsa_arctica.AAC.1
MAAMSESSETLHRVPLRSVNFLVLPLLAQPLLQSVAEVLDLLPSRWVCTWPRIATRRMEDV